MNSSDDSVSARRWCMLLGADLIAALIATVVLVAFLPSRIPLAFAKDVYGLVAGSLAIIFSVFVAALATIVSASDNEFVKFLDEDGTFGDILWGMTATLIALFVALTIGGIAYGWTSWELAQGVEHQSRWPLVVVASTLTYSLFSTLSSTYTTVRYARLRARYLRVTDISVKQLGSSAPARSHEEDEKLPQSRERGGA